MNQDGVIGVELHIDPGITTVLFYSLVSSQPGIDRPTCRKRYHHHTRNNGI